VLRNHRGRGFGAPGLHGKAATWARLTWQLSQLDNIAHAASFPRHALVLLHERKVTHQRRGRINAAPYAAVERALTDQPSILAQRLNTRMDGDSLLMWLPTKPAANSIAQWKIVYLAGLAIPKIVRLSPQIVGGTFHDTNAYRTVFWPRTESDRAQRRICH